MQQRDMIRNISITAMLAAAIGISGAFKIPGIVPGGEFQLSAPIAVAICGVFGFKMYITAGIMASAVSLMLGLQTVLNVVIAMSFRIVVGMIWLFLGSRRLFYIISGPIGTAAARGILSAMLGKGFWLMLAAAVPGMIFTACTAWFMAEALKRGLGFRKYLTEK